MFEYLECDYIIMLFIIHDIKINYKNNIIHSLHLNVIGNKYIYYTWEYINIILFTTLSTWYTFIK